MKKEYKHNYKDIDEIEKLLECHLWKLMKRDEI